MSRIGKMPVQILNGVTVALENDLLKVKGAKGELSQSFLGNDRDDDDN